MAFVHQVLADVEADAAGADHGDPLADRLLVAQHVDVAQHLAGMGVLALDARVARRDARCQQHLVVLAADEVVGRHARVEVQAHAGLRDQLAEVADGLVEFLLAGNPLGHVELAADLA
jgi:hypothetical protein